MGFQRRLVQVRATLGAWGNGDQIISLLDTVRHAKPTVLIGVSGQPGLFTQEVIREMHASCQRPIVMPLSNPTSRAEALPEDIIRWTDGRALVASGSPFPPVRHNGESFPIVQCNNSYIFPGIGLGVIASGARRVTDAMLMAASNALAACSPLAQGKGNALLPSLEQIQEVSKTIAFHVAKAAMNEDVARKLSDDELQAAIRENFWVPEYRAYTRASESPSE